MFPIVIMCVMPWVVSMEVKNIVVDVVDGDRSTASQQLVHQVEASNYFLFGGQKASYDEALAEVERGDADVIMVIPPQYEHDLVRGESPQILVAANAVNGTKGAMGSAYLTQIIASASPRSTLNSNPLTLNSKLSTLNLYNKQQNYKLFMIPALLAIVIMLMTGFLPALNIGHQYPSGRSSWLSSFPIGSLQCSSLQSAYCCRG